MLGITPTATIRRGYAPSAETSELLDELEHRGIALLCSRLDRLFESADDMLFNMFERASSNKRQGLYIDTIRDIRLGRRGITDAFCQAITAMFHQASGVGPSGAEPDEPTLTMQDEQTLERDIAISSMSAKATEQYKTELWQLGCHVSELVEERHATVSPELLSPHAICVAFRDSVRPQPVAFDVELLIYKLFERCVIDELQDVYARLLQIFRRHGFKPPVAVIQRCASVSGGYGPATVGANARDPQPAGTAAPPKPAEFSSLLLDGTPQSPQTVPGLDPALTRAVTPGFAPTPSTVLAAAIDSLTLQTLANLSNLRSTAADRQYGNVQLAADLAAAVDGAPVAYWRAQQAEAYVQRAALVGRLFNGILDDPHLPPGIKPQFEQLRFSVIKSALKDATFIHDPGHPVRGLIQELADLAAHARVAGSVHLRRIAEMLGQIHHQFEVAAQAVRNPAADLKPVAEETALRFILDLEERAEARRIRLIQRVRLLVRTELQLRTLGLGLPELVRQMLNSGWGPMMAMNLLRHGADAPCWTQGLKLLDEVIEACDRERGARTRTDTAATRNLLGRLCETFLEVGLKAERVRDLLAGFERALQAVSEPGGPAADAGDAAQPAAEAVPPAAAEAELAEVLPQSREALLAAILQPGVWFRIHDPSREGPRWLKAVAYYSDKDRATFAEFNGRNSHCVRAERLLEDLIAERSYALDPPPAVERALMALKAKASHARPGGAGDIRG